MSILRQILSLVLILLGCNVRAQEIRTSIIHEIEILKFIEAEYELGLRNFIIPDNRNEQYYFGKTGAQMKLTNWFKVGGDLRYGKSNFNENVAVKIDDYSVFRSGVEIALRTLGQCRDYEWSYRLRYQSNFESDADIQKTIRHRIKLECDLNKRVKSDISLEVFMKMETFNLKKFRFRLGSEFKFDHLDVEFYFFSDNILMYDHYLYYQQMQALGVNIYL